MESVAPIIDFDSVSFSYPEAEEAVFIDLSLSLPPGITSLIGQNGVGKTSFLLLAGGRLLPQKGGVRILGRDTKDFRDEEDRNRACSFVYQNMEFDTEDPIGILFEYVLASGSVASMGKAFIDELVGAFELRQELGKKTQQLSKGAMQRVVMAFSLLYGSPIVIMDEPVFALEQGQKEKALAFLREHSKNHGVSILCSLHEIDLTRNFADRVALFFKGGRVELGSVSEMTGEKKLEEAYQIPFAMLRSKEELTRQFLSSIDRG